MAASADRPLSTFFEEVFAPLYPAGYRAELADIRAHRPEPCSHPGTLARLDDIAETFKRLAPSLLRISDASLDDTDASIHRLSVVLTRDRREALLAQHTAEQPVVPLLAVLAIHGAIYVGRCIVRNHGGLWLVRRPLWESSVWLRSRVGEAELPVFQWWVKSLSDGEVDRTPLADRYRAHVEMPCFDPSGLPVLSSAPQPIPRLDDPRYDRVVEHLRRHAPEVRTLGNDFPTPERFAQYGFLWLAFEWLGGGRMLLMHGPAQRQGAHLFWLDAQGFVKAAFYPSDVFPAHRIEVEGDSLRVIVSIDGQVRCHDLPWWGL